MNALDALVLIVAALAIGLALGYGIGNEGRDDFKDDNDRGMW